MKYFSTLPKIIYNNPITGSPIILTDILARSSIVQSAMKNPLLYYQYEVQQGDTPEIIAFKYYGDVSRFWIVLLANQFLDPQWSFPMSTDVFALYINHKYNQNNDPKNLNPYVDIYSTIQEYNKVITQFDSYTGVTTVNTLVVDQSTYANTAHNTATYSSTTGPVTITTTKNQISIYDYEEKLNESKRTISIVNSNYVDVVEAQFKKLMA